MEIEEGTRLKVIKSGWVLQVPEEAHECYLYRACGQIYTIQKVFKEHVIAVGQSGRCFILTISDLNYFNVISD